MDVIDDTTLVFHKRGGTTNKGIEYENLLIAHWTLSFTQDDAIKDFRISSNDENFGAFDDIVLELEKTDGDVEKFAIQVKHSDDRILTKSSLTEATGNFSVKKYLNDFRKIRNDEFKFCLYTNRKFEPSRNESDKQIKIADFDCRIKDGEKNRLNSGHCFKFVAEPSDAFFDKFFLLTNQGGVETLRRSIKEFFERVFQCRDYSYKKFIDFVTEWSELKGKKSKLCKNLVRRKLVLILLGDVIRPIKVGGEGITMEMTQLRHFIMSRHATPFSTQSESGLVELWRDLEFDCHKPEVSKLARLYRVSPEDPSILLWLLGKCPLLVTRNSPVIDLCLEMNFVILDDSLNRKLTRLPDDISSTFKCSLQGKEPVCLRDLKVRVGTDDLIKIATGSGLQIGNAEILPFPHITRSLTRNVYNLNILDFIDFGLEGDTLVVITNYKRGVQLRHRIMDSEAFFTVKETNWEFCNGKVLFVTEREYSYQEFDEICSLNPGKNLYFHFSLIPSGLELVRSRGGIPSGLFLLENQYLTESELMTKEKDNRIHVVCARPGMGKTTLMKNLKNSTSPTIWTLLIRVSNHCGHFHNITAFLEHILSETDEELGKHLIRQNRVKLIWDGLDEVSTENRRLILDLIKKFASTGITQWITSRDHLKETLERTFNVTARTIKEFDEDDQKRYVKERLRCADDEHLDTVFAKIKRNIELFPGNDILGIPLQIYLLTELLPKDETMLDNNLFTIFDLYEHFVDGKFDLYFTEKENIATSNDLCNQRRHHHKQHTINLYERLAIRHYGFDVPTVKFVDPVGILVNVRGEVAEFVHTSFLEFFAASFLTKNRYFLVDFAEFLREECFNNVRFFFDLRLAKNCRPHVAVLYRNLALLESCSDEELKVDDDGGRNALHIACSWGKKYDVFSVGRCSDIDDCVVINDGHPIETHDGEDYWRIFEILEKCCDKNQIDGLGRMTALSYAYKSSCLMPFAKLLYTVNFSDFDDEETLCTAIYYCIVLDFDRIFEVVRNIPQIETNFYAPLLHLAIKHNSIKCVKHLTEGQDLDWSTMVASRLGFYDIVEYFIRCGSDVNSTNYDGITPVVEATKNGHFDVVKLLLDNGACVNQTKPSGTSILHLAVKYKHLSIVKLLVEEGCDVNIVNKDGNIPLQVLDVSEDFFNIIIDEKFCRTRPFDETSSQIVKLLAEAGSNLNAKNKYGRTVLHEYTKLFMLELVQIIIENDADVNIADDEQKTPLHIACENNDHTLAKLLIKNGAKVNLVTTRQQTPLHLTENSQVIILLLNNNANPTIPDIVGDLPIHIQSALGNHRVVELLIECGSPVNCQNKLDQTPLHKAFENYEFDIKDLLINKGADVNVRMKNGNTALHLACQAYDPRMVTVLIDKNADVNAVNQLGETPLHWACEEGNYDIVKCLIDNGADVNAVTKYDESPLDMARKHESIVELLKL